MTTETNILYRVNIYFTTGKSLGFIGVDLDSKVCDQLSTDIRNVISCFESRVSNDVIKISDGHAMYYVNIYEIAYIEVLKRKSNA